jgi:hypothetical protein
MWVSGHRNAPAALYPRERTPGTHWTGGWVGPRAVRDTKARRNILCPCRGSKLDRPVVQSGARHTKLTELPSSHFLPEEREKLDHVPHSAIRRFETFMVTDVSSLLILHTTVV